MMLNMKEDLHIHCNYNDHSSKDLTIPNIINKSETLWLRKDSHHRTRTKKF